MFFTWEQIQLQVNLISQSGILHILFLIMLMDILTGFVKSFKNKNSSSTVGLFGLLKHILVVLLTLIISVYFPLFGYEIVAQGFIIYLILTYAISIAENWALLGLPMPAFILERLIKLRDEMDTGRNLKQELKRKEEEI